MKVPAHNTIPNAIERGLEAACKQAPRAAIGAAIGTGSALAGRSQPHLRRSGAAGPAATFAWATTDAVRHGASISTALVAGAKAAVGGPAVIAAATAAAPVVVAVAAAGAVGAGLWWLFSDD